jgi:hypothetical protein
MDATQGGSPMNKRGNANRARSVLAASLVIVALALLAPIAANAQVTVLHVRVTLSPAPGATAGSTAIYCDTATACPTGIQVWNLGGGVSLSGGQTLVLTQTGVLAGIGGNFDTSDRVRPTAPTLFPCLNPNQGCTVTIELDTGAGLATVFSSSAGNPINNFNGDTLQPNHHEESQYGAPVFSAPNYTLSLGYADNVHGCLTPPPVGTVTTCFPNPFDGSFGTTAATRFIGVGAAASATCSGNCFDAGVLLIRTITVPLKTVTQGGWGAPPRGNNPGAFLLANFSKLGGPVVIGCPTGFKLTFTSAGAIQNFLPQGGPPSTLTGSATNPLDSSAGVFAGQVLALQLNVSFSNLGIAPFNPGLGSFVLPSGPAAGKTVNQVLADANKALGGCGLPSYVSSIAQLNDIVSSINEMFD